MNNNISRIANHPNRRPNWEEGEAFQKKKKKEKE